MKYEIQHLPSTKWKGHILPIGYTTEEYYDISVHPDPSGFQISVLRKQFTTPVTHTPEEYDYPDRLYADWWEGACAWGVLIDGKLAGAIETAPEEWSNRLRVTELWVDDKYHRQGMGHALMAVAKEQAFLERRRAVILETQSCNVNAVGFYLHEGFTLIGMDTCCYSNTDLKRKEVRVELGWFPEKRKKLTPGEVEIREIRLTDHYAVERMAQEAFWNRHQKGCMEHWLVHKLWESEDYLSKLSRTAVKDGEIIGAILYSRSCVKDGEKCHDTVTFGPLCVSPKWHGSGVGEMLLKETMKLAADAGYPGIVIFGEPGYYPRFGFKICDQFAITTADGRNFDAFMAIELIPGAMKEIHGKFYEAKVFEECTEEETENYNSKFPSLEKQYFPGQWE